MIKDFNISPDVFIKRIPFLKTFNNLSRNGHVFFQKVSYNKNKKIMMGDDLFEFPNVNVVMEFKYSKNQIRENHFFNFNLDTTIIITKPKHMDQLTYTVFLVATKHLNKKLSLNKEIISKSEQLTTEQLNQIINEINGKFFQIEEFINNMSFNIKNPLDESKMIKEKLIIESFAKNFNKIKRIDEQEVDELNIAKGIASLGMAASLAGAPDKSIAQPIQTKSIEAPIPTYDSNDISQMSNQKAAVTLLLSYTKNPFSATEWGKIDKNNYRFFNQLKKMLDYRMETGRFEDEDLETLGSKYKTTPIAQSFINRDTKDKTTYTMKEDGVKDS